MMLSVRFDWLPAVEAQRRPRIPFSIVSALQHDPDPAPAVLPLTQAIRPADDQARCLRGVRERWVPLVSATNWAFVRSRTPRASCRGATSVAVRTRNRKAKGQEGRPLLAFCRTLGDPSFLLDD